MFGFVHRRKTSGKNITQVEKQPKSTKVVYRDELTKKQSPSKTEKKSVRFADSAPTTLGGKDCEKSKAEETTSGIRVKVRMTKEEAKRLLSKCKEGGVLEFKDVARELVSIPVNRVTVMSISSIDKETSQL